MTITVTLHPNMFWRLAPEYDEEGFGIPGSIAPDDVEWGIACELVLRGGSAPL